ncbi:hypothetical protein PABG_06943 [Paracoccidioides brasiliensis Pb03]|nr:hypothetical protein PABG_06943 [Paracoccidioides brasiliensis Pb03]
MSAGERSASSWKRLNVTLCFELSLGKQIIAFKGAREERARVVCLQAEECVPNVEDLLKMRELRCREAPHFEHFGYADNGRNPKVLQGNTIESLVREFDVALVRPWLKLPSAERTGSLFSTPNVNDAESMARIILSGVA